MKPSKDKECPACEGWGYRYKPDPDNYKKRCPGVIRVVCSECGGTGKKPKPA